MNVKTNSLLHYVLIILLMITPLRGVLAMPQAHCQMDEMADVMAVSSENAVSHGKHDMSNMSLHDSSHHNSHPSLNQPDTEQAVADDHQCCCCDDGHSCAGNCDIGMSVSLVLQSVLYAPAFIDVTLATPYSSDLLIRELTPPSRPPANLHS